MTNHEIAKQVVRAAKEVPDELLTASPEALGEALVEAAERSGGGAASVKTLIEAAEKMERVAAVYRRVAASRAS